MKTKAIFKRMLYRLLSCAIIAGCVISSLSLPSYAAGMTGDEIVARLSEVEKQYPNNTTFIKDKSTKGDQCFAFAREVFYKVFGKSLPALFIGATAELCEPQAVRLVNQVRSGYTLSQLKTLLSEAKPGDVLAMKEPPSTRKPKGSQHFVIVRSVAKDGSSVWIDDANSNGYNIIRINHQIGASAIKGCWSVCVSLYRSVDYVECSHAYETTAVSDGSYPYAAVCKKCGTKFPIIEIPLSVRYEATESGRAICSAPYQDARTGITTVKGDGYNVVAYTNNAYGSRWYKTSDNYWIYSDWLVLESKSDITATTENGKWTVTIPANLRLLCYANADANSNSTFIAARSTAYPITCTKKATFPNGSVRYFFKSGDNKELWFDFTSSMSVSNASATTSNSVEVVFDANGGTVTPSKKSLTRDSSIGTLPTPVRTGYTFDGWYTSREGGAVYTTTTTIGENTTLYAHWKVAQKSVKVTFDANGGYTPQTTKTVTALGTYGDLPTPTRDGYRFLGWFSQQSGSGIIYLPETAVDDEDVTMYAHWEKVETIKTSISFKNLTTPGNLNAGSGGHIDGSIMSSSSPIISVTAEVYSNSTGRAVLSASTSGFSLSTYGPIRGSKLDNDLSFGSLDAGTYYIRYTVNCKDGTQTTKDTSVFTISSPTVIETPKTTSITFSSLTTPGNLTVGNDGHIDGYISSTNSPITSVRADVYNSSTGSVVMSAYTSGFSLPSYGPIKGSKLDNDLMFGSLTAGSYFIQYTVTCVDGTQCSDATSTFQVSAPASTPTSPSSLSVVSFNSLTTPGNLKVGNGAHIDGSITSSGAPIVVVRAYVIDESTGDVVLSASTSGFSLSTYGPIRGSKIDNELTFGSLPVGTYHIHYAVSLSDGTLEVGITSSFQVSR